VEGHPLWEEKESEDVQKAIAYLLAHGIEGIADAPDYVRGRALFEALLKRSLALRHEDPAEMVTFARWAVMAVRSLAKEGYEAQDMADFHCRAWMELANAHRVADSIAFAENAMNVAQDHYCKGTKNDALTARFLTLQASLQGDLRQFELASTALDVVAMIQRRQGEDHLAGRALIKKGLYLSYSGRSEEALKVIREGMALINREKDPSLYFAAVQNEARALKDCGRLKEARLVLWANLQRQEAAGGRLNLLKLQWLEGEINVGLGELERAGRSFLMVKQGFEEAGMVYTASVVSLDLAAVWLDQGRAFEARALACEAAEVFLSLRIHREAMTAVMILQKCFETERATARLIKSVADYLRESERDKTARFTPVF